MWKKGNHSPVAAVRACDVLVVPPARPYTPLPLGGAVCLGVDLGLEAGSCPESVDARLLPCWVLAYPGLLV